MKRILFLGFAIAAAGLSTAGAQTFTSRVGGTETQQATRRPPPDLTFRPVVGAVPRAARGNPLQMLNPRAPAKYRAPVNDTVTYDDRNPSRITGIILFGLRW